MTYNSLKRASEMFSFPIFIIFIAPKRCQDPQNSHNFSPIFGGKLVNLTMKNQTRNKNVLVRQSENTPLSTGDHRGL